MTPIEPTRFADGAPMLLAGLRHRHRFAAASQSVPAQWASFRQLGALPGQRGEVSYGVVCASDPGEGWFEYMTGAEVEGFEALPAELGRMRIPAQRYAVFTHRGRIEGLRATWDAIWQEWLPGSGEQPADTPDFEVYDPARFDEATGRWEVEIWFPIAVRGQRRWTPTGFPAH
ncbi:MAG TPA: GyrI-like domain-containing protein [Gemmatimonadaceae bacterium]